MLSIDRWFLWTAMIGGALFLVQLVLQFVLGGAVDADAGGDVGGAGTGDSVGHHAADASFKILSLQGLTAFLTMFGLVGMALRSENQWGPFAAVLGATLAGVIATWLVARIFRAFSQMQSSGTLDMRAAVGAEGSVYLTVARNKPGQVQISVKNRLLTLDATTHAENPLVTGVPIRVVEVLSDRSVVVEARTNG